MTVGRRDEHGSRPDSVTLGGLHDVEAWPAPGDLGHQAPRARIKMLDDDDGRRKVCGKAHQHLADGSDTPRRRRHGDDVEFGSWKPLRGFGWVEIAPLR